MIMHMLLQIEPDAQFFTLDTGRPLPRDLRDLAGARAALRHRDRGAPAPTCAQGRHARGRRPEACCGIRKVKPLREALRGCGAWVTGLRRDQSPTRANAPKLGWDEKHGLWKFDPLATGRTRTSGRYIAEHDIPYNDLHDRGYASIGCTPCTQAGSGREGRWAGSGQDRVRTPREDGHERTWPPRRGFAMTAVSYEVSHLRALEAEAIHVMREVAAEVERAGAAVLRRQGLDRAAAARREGVPPGEVPVPGDARRHRPQLPRGDRVPRPPDGRARRAADRRHRSRTRSTPAGSSRRPARAPRATGSRP